MQTSGRAMQKNRHPDTQIKTMALALGKGSD
jgi:hypothetical protein